VVHWSSETSTNQSDVIIQSDDRFLYLVVDSDSYCLNMLNFILWVFFWSSYWQTFCSFIPAVFFLILTSILQFCPSLLLTLSQYRIRIFYCQFWTHKGQTRIHMI
jgi:hypothetical protein